MKGRFEMHFHGSAYEYESGSHLDLALGLHHLEFGLGQILLQLPDLGPEGLFLLVISPLLGLYETLNVLAQAWFWRPSAFGRVLRRGGSFLCSYSLSAVWANTHCALEKEEKDIYLWFNAQALQSFFAQIF